jgi:hypothetical protein
MSVKVIIVNGYPLAGKDTFAKDVCDILNVHQQVAYVMSSVDIIKEIALYSGWDGVKTSESRKGLSDLKHLLDKWLHTSWNSVAKRISELNLQCSSNDLTYYLFVMVREPLEIRHYREVYGAISVYVKRGVPPKTSNDADAEVEEYTYDYYISNDGTLDDLYQTAAEFAAMLEQ